jgi:type IX secretion system PorP/SprF family membrane protein
MKKLFLLFFLVPAGFNAFSQQDPVYSQYLVNPFVINPAYAGFSRDFTGMASYRRQWVGFDGAPTTFNATGHIALAENKMGVGIFILSDQIGSNNNTEVQAAYAYHLPLENNKRLSFGLQGGIVNYRSNYDDLTIDRSDPKFQNAINEIVPTFGAGVIYSTDNFYGGFSVPKLMNSTTSLDGMEVALYNRQAYAFAAYLFTLSPRVKLKPFALLRYTGGPPLNADVGVSLMADDSYMLGLFTRSLNTYGVMARINLGDTMRIGYVFELPTNQSVGSSFVSHEVTVGFRIKTFRFHDIGMIMDF